MRRLVFAWLSCTALAAAAQTVLVQQYGGMRYLANGADPGIPATSWTAESYDDAGWTDGWFGVGYEAAPPGARALIQSPVPPGTASVYARARFAVSDLGQIGTLRIGADYDDGWIAWINGVEVYRSPEMAPGAPVWNSAAALHESGNGTAPDYGALIDITANGAPALHAGINVLAIGVWNNAPGSSDLVIVPQLSSLPPGAISVTRGPYLQRPTPTSVIVRWRTNAATDSRVLYGDSPGTLAQSVATAPVVTDHEVTVSGLTPGTAYYYAVGTTSQVLAGGAPAYRFSTSPPVDRASPYRFWILGDPGTADANQALVRDRFLAYNGARRLDAILLLGDNAYSVGTDAQYQTAIFDMYAPSLRGIPLWSAYGNHDSYSANAGTQSGPYFDLFSFPRAAEAGGIASGTEAYYSFDHGNVHFIVLDSMTAAHRDAGGPMMTWLQQDLAATQDREWRIALWHHPPYSKGSHDSDNPGGGDFELAEMRATFLPVLEQAGIDLVLCGHSHAYERSFLIDSHYGLSTSFTPAMKLDGGDGRPAGNGAYRKASRTASPHAGTVYTVAGSAGQTGGGALNHPAMYLSLDRLGSVALDVNGGRIDLTFIDGAGAAADRFTLFKGPPSPRPVPDGAFFAGAPMRAAKLGTGALRLTWDVTACRASAQYEVLWGYGSGLPGYALSGADCDIGDRGSYDWSAPPPPGAEHLVWWVVVGTDGGGTEGSWGLSGSGAEPGGAVPSGRCGVTVKNPVNNCP